VNAGQQIERSRCQVVAKKNLFVIRARANERQNGNRLLHRGCTFRAFHLCIPVESVESKERERSCDQHDDWEISSLALNLKGQVFGPRQAVRTPILMSNYIRYALYYLPTANHYELRGAYWRCLDRAEDLYLSGFAIPWSLRGTTSRVHPPGHSIALAWRARRMDRGLSGPRYYSEIMRKCARIDPNVCAICEEIFDSIRADLTVIFCGPTSIGFRKMSMKKCGNRDDIGVGHSDVRGLHAHRNHPYPSNPAQTEVAIMVRLAISNSADPSPKLKVAMNSDMVNPIPPNKPIPNM